MKTFLRTPRFLTIVFLIANLFFVSAAFGQASVTSDKPDYPPLSNAVFTGVGFSPNENVLLKVENLTKPINTTSGDSSYSPWTVTADADGTFITNWTVCNCSGDLLRVSAYGQSSGENVWHEFTDTSITSTATGGNWNLTTTWVGGVVPGAGDIVTIAVDATVTVIDNRSATSITIAGGSKNTKLQINPGIILSVSGDVTINSPGSNSRTNEIIVGSGILNIGGNLTVNGAAEGSSINNRQGQLTVSTGTVDVNGNITTNAAGANSLISFSGAGTLKISGNWVHGGSFTKSTSTVIFDGLTQSISGGAVIDFNNLTITAGATVTGNSIFATTATGTFTIQNGGKFIQTAGTAILGGTRSFGATSTYETQTSLSSPWPNISYGNVIINTSAGNMSAGGNLQTVLGSLTIQNTTGGSFGLSTTSNTTTTISGNLIINNGLFNFSTNTGTPTVNVSGNVLINGGTLQPMTSTGIPIFNLTGNWTNNGGIFTAGTGTVTFNGGSQTIGGSSPTTFGALTIAGSADKTLGNDITINGALVFSANKINTGANTLILGNSATVSGAGTGKYVNGNLRKGIAASTSSKNFEIGDASNYTPVNIGFSGTGTNGTGNITAFTQAADDPNIATSAIDDTKNVNRYWSLVNSGVTFGTYNATFNFVAGDMDGLAAFSNFIVGKYSSGWTYPIVGTKTAASTQAIGLSAFSTFVVGEGGAGAPTLHTNPISQTICAGSSVNFIAKVNSIPPTPGSGVEWQVDNGSGFVALTIASPYSVVTSSSAGVTTSTLSISPAAAGLNTYKYRAKFTNTKGSFTTGFATLTIDLIAPTWTTGTTALNVTKQCSDAAGITAAQALFPVASDNFDTDVTNIVKTSGSFVAGTLCPQAGTYTNIWTVTDDCGNASLVFTQTITVKDNTAPVVTTATNSLDALTLECSDTAGIAAALALAPAATDNCTAVPTINLVSDDTTAGSCANNYTRVRVWNFTDGCGNTSANFTQTITVKDNTAPVISTCAPAVTVSPNNAGCSYKQTGTGWDVTATDNCGSTTIKYTLSGATISAVNAYATLNNVVFNLGVTTVTAIAYDACNNASAPCSFTVTVTTSILSATIATNNTIIYFGYSGDQTATITAYPSGGTAPYKVSITMVNPQTVVPARIKERVDGKLICDYINTAGDEVWVPGTNTYGTTGNSGNNQPTSTSNANIPTGGSYSVNVTLLTDARFVATVTDKYGCSYTIPYDQAARVDAEDARCFAAGNSGNAKVTICHRTGSTKNPCVAICVDESAVQEHLNHGDFLGKCTPDFIAPKSNAKLLQLDKIIIEPASFDVKAYPNPTQHQFTLVVEGGSNEKVEVIVYDMLARMVKRFEKSDGQPIMFGEELPTGEYLTVIKQGVNIKTVNLIKQ
ncbi:HYR-like domain-containing protein [Flavobacterium gawalongense]|uniref:HYR-like domain-containing protein n=1 Tax=Flavobacterium gawalongense TaxID=2594432 RepID=UPI001186937B|nr:T9SS type A sorting domain-containing protein [Flavobacterium gawalongense]TRX29811.1 T9SS type A sorting domain-containing protein [Flavobacterium gawalongense]